MSSVIPGLRPKGQLKGKYVDLVVYVSQVSGREFIQGVIKCPFTNKEFRVSIIPQMDQARLGVVQVLGGFENHVLRVKDYGKWIVIAERSYGNSSRKRRYFVCAVCGYESARFIDALLHSMRIHGFLLTKP